MEDKIMIKLVKPEHDLYRLEAVLVNTTAALHTYLLNGKRNPLIGKSDSDFEFERFEKFITGVENVNLLFPNTIEFKNCNTQEEANVEWQKICKKIVASVKYSIGLVEPHRNEITTYPNWLRSRCEFAINKFYKYLIAYLQRDADLKDIDFDSIEPMFC